MGSLRTDFNTAMDQGSDSVTAEHAGVTPRGRRLALIGVWVNLGLAVGKLIVGVVGHSYALIADAIESFVDVAGSVVVWLGMKVAAKPPDEDHPYGHGRAESLAALAVAIIIFLAGIGIAIEAVREILTPHRSPAWYTLLALVLVVMIKESMARWAAREAKREGSVALSAESFHHRADVLTSIFAFIGISIALIGGKGWEPADDWAALAASAVILFNAARLGFEPLNDLLDVDHSLLTEQAAKIAASVEGVKSVDKPRTRRSGAYYWIDMHVRVDDELTVRQGHDISHRVKDAVRAELPQVRDVLVHLEPCRRPDSDQQPLANAAT
jgi:cation diffusion facilitator family transporter